MKPTVNREIVGDLVARAFVGTLFVLLTVNFLTDFVRTGRITGLFFVVSEALVVILTIIRRRAQKVDHSFEAAALTIISLLGPPLVRSAETPGIAPDWLTAGVSIVGLVIVIAGKLTIGRSFGIAPAIRGIVDSGPYSVVRHPIYTGYLLTHAAALAAYPSVWNVTLILTADVALVLRALVEERILRSDVRYQAYCQRVSWHLVPGVF